MSAKYFCHSKWSLPFNEWFLKMVISFQQMVWV